VAGNQTVPTRAPVENYHAPIADSGKQADSRVLTYLMTDLAAKPGKLKIGDGCLFKRLSDVDMDVLRGVVGRSVTTSRAMGE
jgi:hypothetical protein